MESEARPGKPQSPAEIWRSVGLEVVPPEDIVAALTQPKCPTALPIAAALGSMETLAPLLLACVDRVASGAAVSEADGNLLFRGLFLLAGARHTPAFRPVIALLRARGLDLDDLLGDVLTDGLQRIMASLYADGDFALLSEAILDPDLEPWACGALLEAMTFLCLKGRVPRQDAESLLTAFDRAARDAPDSLLWTGWAVCIEMLALRSLLPNVEAAFADGRITPDMMSIDHVKAGLDLAESRPDDVSLREDRLLGYVEDVWQELQRFDQGEADDRPAADQWPAIPGTMRNPLRHVGRNDPCPCGSGRKYKKCCLEKQRS